MIEKFKKNILEKLEERDWTSASDQSFMDNTIQEIFSIIENSIPPVRDYGEDVDDNSFFRVEGHNGCRSDFIDSLNNRSRGTLCKVDLNI